MQTSASFTGNVSAFAVIGQDFLAGTYGTSTENYGAFLTTDNGTNWTEADANLQGVGEMAFAVNGTYVFAGTPIGIYRTTNNGATWSFKVSGITGDRFTYALALSGTNLFAGTYGGVYLSTDSATSWKEADSGMTNKTVVALAVSDTNIFAGTQGGGVFLSTNNGTSWTAVDSGLTNLFVSALAVNGTNLFAATGNGANGANVFLSTNNGTNWTSVSTGLPKNSSISSLAATGTNLFAGANGVYLLGNNGGSWTSVSSGLPSGGVGALVVFGSYLFAGKGGNVFRRPLSDLTSVADRPEAIPSHFELSQNYPNPFNPSTSIKYQIASASHVTLEIFDILGRAVATLVNEVKQPGTYTIRWDASNMASGAYFYRIQAGDFLQTRKLLLIK